MIKLLPNDKNTTPKSAESQTPLERGLLLWWASGKTGVRQVWRLAAECQPTTMQWQRLAFAMAWMDYPEALEVVAQHCDVLALRSNCVIDEAPPSWAEVDEIDEESLRAAQDCARDRSSLLSFSASAGSLSAVEWLLERGANPAARDAFGRTPLMAAAAAGESACVNALLPVSDACACAHNGKSALSFSMEQMWDDEASPLAIAQAGFGSPDFAKTLKARDNEGLTPLMQAAMRGYANVVHMVVARSDRTARSPMGHTAFDLAQRSPECADILSEGMPLEKIACSRVWVEAVEKGETQRLPRIAARMEAEALRSAITGVQDGRAGAEEEPAESVNKAPRPSSRI